MADLTWNPDVAAWSATLSGGVFEDLEILVTTDGETDPPTPQQLRAVEIIERLTRADREQIKVLARQWGEENLLEEDLEEMEDEDFDYGVTSVIVPRQRDGEDVYFLFAGGTEMEPEHGLGCVCKNGKQFAICHSDYAYENYDWDALDELESLLR